VGGGCQATVTLLFSALHSSGMMAGAAGAAKYEKRIAMWLGSGATERENPKGNTLGDNDATKKEVLIIRKARKVSCFAPFLENELKKEMVCQK